MSEKKTADAVAGNLLDAPLMISQIAVVCRDLQKTMEQYTKLLGWGPWNVYRHSRLDCITPSCMDDRASTRCSEPRRKSAEWASNSCSRSRDRASTPNGSKNTARVSTMSR